MAEFKALLFNCSLKSGEEPSSTQAMLEKVAAVLARHEVECEIVRAADYRIPFGVKTDMGEGDQWPELHRKITYADILVIGAPIWLGHRSGMCQVVLERMDALLNETNAQGQLPLYNKVAGVCVVGNEDGAQNVGAGVLYNLMQFGATIPPNAEAYWVGQAGGQDDFIDVALDDPYANKLVEYLGSNLVHVARSLRANPIPPEGNLNEK